MGCSCSGISYEPYGTSAARNESRPRHGWHARASSSGSRMVCTGMAGRPCRSPPGVMASSSAAWQLLRVLFLDPEGHITSQPWVMERQRALVLASNLRRFLGAQAEVLVL